MSLFGRRFFISYSRDDTPQFARLLHDELERRYGGQRVFFDRADIEHGTHWRDEVDGAVARSDVVVALIGPRWQELLAARDPAEDVLCHELATALRLDKQVVPVLVDGAVMPSASALPAMLQTLPAIQALTVRSSEFHRGLRELLGILKPPWSLAAAWGLGNFVALIVAALVLVFGLQALGEPGVAWPHAGGVALGALFGLIIALPQWLILRNWFQRAAWVLPAYTTLCAIAVGASAGLGMVAAFIAITLLPPLWGIATWLVVRRDLVSAGWWSLANAVAPFLGLMLAAPMNPASDTSSAASNAAASATQAAIAASPGVGGGLLLLLAAVLPQFASGVFLVWLMRRSGMRPLPQASARPPAVENR